MRLFVVLVYFLVAWQACSHSPPIPPTPMPQDDAGVGDANTSDAETTDSRSIYVTTCSHLATIGCEDGKPSNCALVLKKMVDGRLTNINLACLNSAKDIASARKCGGVKCTTLP